MAFFKKRFLLKLGLVALFTAGCKTPKAVTGPDIIDQEYFEYSGYQDTVTLLVKDAETWQKVFDKIYERVEPKPPIKQIDFSKKNLVVFAFGEKSTGGYYYEIRTYKEEGDKLIFDIKSPEQDPYSPVTMALTYPLLIGEIPKTNADKIVYQIKK